MGIVSLLETSEYLIRPGLTPPGRVRSQMHSLRSLTPVMYAGFRLNLCLDTFDISFGIKLFHKNLTLFMENHQHLIRFRILNVLLQFYYD